MTEEQLAKTLAAVVTPQRLYAELNARRKELGWPWWRVAVALDVSPSALNRLRHGAHIQGIRERAPEWLERMDKSAFPDPGKRSDQASSRIREEAASSTPRQARE